MLAPGARPTQTLFVAWLLWPTPPTRCRLGEVCRAFRTLFAAQAFASGPLCINLNTLSWRLMERKRRAAARAQLLAAVSTYAPSVRHLALRYQLDRTTGARGCVRACV